MIRLRRRPSAVVNPALEAERHWLREMSDSGLVYLLQDMAEHGDAFRSPLYRSAVLREAAHRLARSTS